MTTQEYQKQAENMKVKIKKLHPDAVIPKYSKPGDAGMDLVANSISFDDYENKVYGTGISIEIPFGFVGLLFPRSSNAKTDLMLTNHVGVIDSGYRGEIMMKFSRTGKNGVYFKESDYKLGDRIGQLIIMPYPQIEFQEVDELSETERGTCGYGSTGK